MRVAVLGLWHLGSVTAACTASVGHVVDAWDPDAGVTARLGRGTPPVKEPGLDALLEQQIAAHRLMTAATAAEAVRDAEVVWITFDTPVDADDQADVAFVVDHVAAALPFVRDDAVILLSSQLPVGSARAIESRARAMRPSARIGVAVSPENLRLGTALDVFLHPDRVVVGVRAERDRAVISTLFAPITDRLEWMSVESAEMTKHAVNAFLATSVAFINELSAIAERVGADAGEVARGLKTERRIGPHAYLSPGGAFAGGTLARDVNFVRAIGDDVGCDTPLLDGVLASNLAHRGWPRARLQMELGSLAGQRVAVWGLTYKPGTDTLRRSESVALCHWLAGQGATVIVHDPVVIRQPDDLAIACERQAEPIEAARNAAAIVVGTEWPMYREIDRDRLSTAMPGGLVIDANRFLAKTLGVDRRFRVVSVGQPSP
jgi:UDPglucose 6-dehydrogenase